MLSESLWCCLVARASPHRAPTRDAPTKRALHRELWMPGVPTSAPHHGYWVSPARRIRWIDVVGQHGSGCRMDGSGPSASLGKTVKGLRMAVKGFGVTGWGDDEVRGNGGCGFLPRPSPESPIGVGEDEKRGVPGVPGTTGEGVGTGSESGKAVNVYGVRGLSIGHAGAAVRSPGAPGSSWGFVDPGSGCGVPVSRRGGPPVWTVRGMKSGRCAFRSRG